MSTASGTTRRHSMFVAWYSALGMGGRACSIACCRFLCFYAFGTISISGVRLTTFRRGRCAWNSPLFVRSAVPVLRWRFVVGRLRAFAVAVLERYIDNSQRNAQDVQAEERCGDGNSPLTNVSSMPRNFRSPINERAVTSPSLIPMPS